MANSAGTWASYLYYYITNLPQIQALTNSTCASIRINQQAFRDGPQNTTNDPLTQDCFPLSDHKNHPEPPNMSHMTHGDFGT